MEIIEAIEKLKDSHALVCLENRALIKMEKDKVYIWHSQWHSKLSRNDLFHYFNRIRLKFMKMTMVLIWKKMKSIMHGVIVARRKDIFYDRNCL